MADNLNVVFEKFFNHRSRTLWERFPGSYRALVVETNDPLNMNRVRFKCPELHDFDLLPSDCPWAIPDFDLGGSRTGRFSHPCIGDWVWISFEKQHPYGPIWTGFATPTRRKYYTYPQISQITPLSVNETGKPADRPQDYDLKYLPKDGRPMAHGWQDRYGNLDIHSSVGFFPAEHAVPPPPPDNDAISSSRFKQQQSPPLVNDPDKKYMARVTKYGCMFILSDQGYHWKKESGGDVGEFEGDHAKDESFETQRWLMLQQLLNEGSTTDDARRAMILTRYGSRIELRDTGWAQPGPRPSKSRDEFGPKRTLSDETERDLRWIKLRTKGGMLWQAYDKGFDPEEDNFIKRQLIEEQSTDSENEDVHWAGKDARWIRTVTRYGLKIVLDDRGTDDKEAETNELKRANGILIKGRRSPGAQAIPTEGDPRGFYWELNENDKANHTTWGSPNGLTMEMNDRYQYTMIASSMGKDWAAPWQGLKENEFIRKPSMLKSPEDIAYHLKFDHANEYLRLKTRNRQGTEPINPVNPIGLGSDDISQGIEARNGSLGRGPWVEVVDCQHRGLWFSRTNNLGVWRAKKDTKMYQFMDDSKHKIVIYNNEEDGTIEIYSAGHIHLVGKEGITLSSGGNIDIHAVNNIRIQAGGTRLTVASQISTNAEINAADFIESSSGGTQVKPQDPPELPEVLEPDDRGQTYNTPFEECPVEEVEHKDG